MAETETTKNGLEQHPLQHGQRLTTKTRLSQHVKVYHSNVASKSSVIDVAEAAVSFAAHTVHHQCVVSVWSAHWWWTRLYRTGQGCVQHSPVPH